LDCRFEFSVFHTDRPRPRPTSCRLLSWGFVGTLAAFSSSGGVVGYYEIAATLIPILLFGGVVTDRLIPPRDAEWQQRHDVATWALLAAGVLAVTAEIMAITVVVTGIAGQLQRYVVSAALVSGILGAVGAFWLPWLRRSSQAGRESSPAFATAALVIGGLVAVYVLATSVNLATVEELEKNVRADAQVAFKEVKTAQSRLTRARVRKADVTQQLAEARESHERRVVRLLVVKRARIDRRIGTLHRRLDRLRAQGIASIVARIVAEQTQRELNYPARGQH
jgi:hypothetical protein